MEREERGEYRAFYTVLTKSPEWRKLTPLARSVYYPLKLRLGKYGIGECALALLVRDSGWTAAQVRQALQELQQQEKPWLYVEEELLWLRNGWRFDPHNSHTNKNNRAGASRYLHSLPKLNLCNAFARYYHLPLPFPDLLPEGERDLVDGEGEEVGDGVRTGRGRTWGTTEDREQKTENREQKTETPSAPIGASPPAGEDVAKEEPKARKEKAKRAVPYPDSWSYSDAHKELARELRVDLKSEAEHFRDWALAKGSVYKDWNAAFRNWLRNAKSGRIAGNTEASRVRSEQPGRGRTRNSDPTPIGTVSPNGEMEWDGERWRKL